MDSSQNRAVLENWAQHVIRTHIERASKALASYCEKPRSAKRLHAARKQLARLRAALDDLAPLAGVSGDFRDRVQKLHKRAGKVRDADVLEKRVHEYCEGSFGREQAQLRGVYQSLDKKRKKARKKLTAVLARTLAELQA